MLVSRTVRAAASIALMAGGAAAATRLDISAHAGQSTATAVQSSNDVTPCAGAPAGFGEHESEDEMTRTAAPLLAWIVAKTHWDVGAMPPVHFVSREQLTKMYSGGQPTGVVAYSLHCEADHGIYLLDSWKACSLLDRSELLHELVHHLQYLNHVPATCPAEHEWRAYKLQAAWLQDQGVKDPLDLMGVSPLTIYLLSRCPEF